MHEFSITADLIRRAVLAARSTGAVRVTEISLVVGDLSGVEPLLIESAFAGLAVGTPAEGAALRVRREPLRARCDGCGGGFDVPDFRFRCPTCGSGDTVVVAGEGIMIESLCVAEAS